MIRSVPSFRNLPVSPSMPAALDGFKLSANFKIIPSVTRVNENLYYYSFNDLYSMTRLNLYCIYVLTLLFFQ